MDRDTHTQLPHASGKTFITDGGLETDLIFNRGVDLPEFSAYTLLDTEEGWNHLRAYFDDYLALARRSNSGLIVDTPTWCANPDRARVLGYEGDRLDDVNRAGVAFAKEIRDAAPDVNIVVNGVVGPRGDAYTGGAPMTASEARDYHSRQITTFAAAGADMVTGVTINNVNEAIGIVEAAGSVDLPVVLSFTVETDGRLVGGDALSEAVEQVDASTRRGPIYFMINCAHPEHFQDTVQEAPWMERVRGIRANASRCSHEELDNAEELDDGDPVDLGRHYAVLKGKFPHLDVFGGCCGTDVRHVAAIVDVLQQNRAQAA